MEEKFSVCFWTDFTVRRAAEKYKVTDIDLL